MQVLCCADEFGLPTAPSRRFVSAGGLTVVHDGVCEYELIDIHSGPEGATAGTLALTVLRASKTFTKLATNTMDERTFASYAVADSVIYLRTEGHLYRIQAK